MSFSKNNWDGDPDHHLWRNGKQWWIAFTCHTHDGRKFRVRESLGTRERAEARVRRDALLGEYARCPRWKLALRAHRRARDPDLALAARGVIDGAGLRIVDETSCAAEHGRASLDWTDSPSSIDPR